MSMQGTITLIPAKSYDALSKDPDADVSLDGEEFDLGNDWLALHEGLAPMAKPLPFAVEGELCPYGDFEENDTGMNDGFVSAKRAAEISEALEPIAFENVVANLQKKYKKQRFSPVATAEDQEALKELFEVLKLAYRTAKAKKLAVHIGIC